MSRRKELFVPDEALEIDEDFDTFEIHGVKELDNLRDRLEFEREELGNDEEIRYLQEFD